MIIIYSTIMLLVCIVSRVLILCRPMQFSTVTGIGDFVFFSGRTSMTLIFVTLNYLLPSALSLPHISAVIISVKQNLSLDEGELSN